MNDMVSDVGDETKTEATVKVSRSPAGLVRWLAYTLGLLLVGVALGSVLTTRGLLPAIWQGETKKVLINRESGPNTIDFTLFWEVWDKLHSDYLDADKLDDEVMVYGAIEGMTAAIGDPYTVFLPPENNQRAKEDLNGAFEGVGIQLGFIERTLAVISPLEKHPAKAAGIKAGDLILHIRDDDKGVDTDTIGMSLPEAVDLIRGEGGTTVYLTVLHEGEDEPVEIGVRRDTIVVPSVELEIGDIDADGIWRAAEGGSVAWLKLYRFGELTESQWNDAVRTILLRQGANDFAGVVLDVRNNPGGFLTGSVFVASEFLAEGLVVTQQGKYTSQPFSVERNGRLIETPLVVLVNKGSASASEIVAGALRDRLGVKLVGETTFGKGTVQDAEDLRDGAGIHITTGRWLLPSGEWISEEGLKPDVEVALEATGAAAQTESDVPVEEEATEDDREDAQLRRAVEVLSGGIEK